MADSQPQAPAIPTPPILTDADKAKNVAHSAKPAVARIAATVQLSGDQEGALKVHNDGRAAKGLAPLAWDDELTQHAQQWADHLAQIDQMEHSTGDQRPNEGENLAWAWSSDGVQNPLTGGAQMWMDEEKDYHGEAIGEGDFSKYGHYTQCMWNSTTKVGIACTTAANGGVYTVGRYSPPGNWSGQKPY